MLYIARQLLCNLVSEKQEFLVEKTTFLEIKWSVSQILGFEQRKGHVRLASGDYSEPRLFSQQELNCSKILNWIPKDL